MLKEMIGDRIQFAQNMDSWQDAVRQAAKPLLDEGFICQEYIEAMTRNIVENGAYVIIVPGFAMPHARPELGVKKTGMSFLGLREPVKFPEDKDVNVLVALAAEDPEVHLAAMSELAEVLMDDDRLEELFKIDSTDKLKEFLDF